MDGLDASTETPHGLAHPGVKTGNAPVGTSS